MATAGYDEQRVPVDLARIRSRAADIRSALEVLRNYATRPDDGFLGNPEAIRSARYAIIVLVEAAVSICNHLCSRVVRKAPSSYGDCFLLLADSGILSGELAMRLARMAGFRNLLVHGYAKVDDRRLLHAMRHDLGDVEEYLAQIEVFLKGGQRNGSGEPARSDNGGVADTHSE